MNPATTRSLVLVSAVLALVTPSALADRIYRTSGTPIEDCSIVSETVTEVLYKEGGRGREIGIPSEEVLRVEYSRVPALVGDAESLLEEGDLGGAIDLYSRYLDEFLAKPDKRFPWAGAYAASRLVTHYGIIGDAEGVVAAADRLLESFPESRYVPSAFVAKADAQARMQKLDRAQATLAEFEKLIVSKNLSKRWTLECRLAQVLTDRSLVGEARRTRLRQLEADAATDFPTVEARAAVARGETFLVEASEKPDSVQRAREIFEDVLGNPAADEESLAGAYAGLGECLFTTAQGDKDALGAAAQAFMRVPVLYGDQVRYVPKALFYAGRSFELLGGEDNVERARKVYIRVVRDYPDSGWASEAKNFLR